MPLRGQILAQVDAVIYVLFRRRFFSKHETLMRSDLIWQKVLLVRTTKTKTFAREKEKILENQQLIFNTRICPYCQGKFTTIKYWRKIR